MEGDNHTDPPVPGTPQAPPDSHQASGVGLRTGSGDPAVGMQSGSSAPREGLCRLLLGPVPPLHGGYLASLDVIRILDSCPETKGKSPSLVLAAEKFKADFGSVSSTYV